jgi:SAM-dependent methyltransferase
MTPRTRIRDARRTLHDAAGLLRAVVTTGGEQEFLGARWTDVALALSPPARKHGVARRLLSLSPHYVCVPSMHGTKLWPRASEIETELERNRRSRRALVRDLVLPRVSEKSVVLDYGCGPGFAAAAIADHTRWVSGADIARSILRCAAVLNQRPNLDYLQVVNGRTRGLHDQSVDFAYSFAVLQHLTRDACRGVVTEIFRVTKPGAQILLHVVLGHPGWRTESELFGDQSIAGRLRARFALRCFARERDDVIGLLREAGFDDIQVIPASELTDVQDDIREQHLVTAVRGHRHATN